MPILPAYLAPLPQRLRSLFVMMSLLVVTPWLVTGCGDRADDVPAPPVPAEAGVATPAVAMEEGAAQELALPSLKAVTLSAEAHSVPVSFELANGLRGWAVQLEGNHALATPCVVDGRVYIGGGFGSYDFYCLDAATGEQIWRVRTTDDGPTAAVVVGEYVCFNTESCTLEVRLTSTGELVWGRWLGDPLMSQPAATEEYVVVCFPRGGGPVPNQQLQMNSNVAPPINNQNAATPGTEDAPSDAAATAESQQAPPVEANLNTQRKTAEAPEAHHKPVPRGKVVHGHPPVEGEGTHALACYALATGELRWIQSVPADCITAPVIDDGVVYAATFDGTVTTLDLESGELLGKEQQNATSAPWVIAAADAPRGKLALVSQRDSQEIAGERHHWESLRRLDISANATEAREQRRLAPHLHEATISTSRYYSEEFKAAQDAGVGFAQAPVQANTGAANRNVGESRIAALWAFEGSRPLVDDDGHLITTLGNQVSLASLDGTVEWSQVYRPAVKERLLTPPAAVGQQLVYASLDGHVFTLERATGKVRHAARFDKRLVYQPAVVDGVIFVGSLDGWVIALDTDEQSLDGWSMWGGGPRHNGVE